MPKTFIEFFAGIGLVHEALGQLGWRAVLANDNDLRKRDTYLLNYPGVPFADCCISELDVSALPPVSLATASFPCIDLSQAGYRTGISGKQSGLVWTFLEKVAAMAESGNQPDCLLIENVPNILSIHDGQAIDHLLGHISHLGYALDLVQVDARHFVPQSRNRVFIIAVSSKRLKKQQGEFSESHIRRYKVAEAISRNRHLPWHFFDFPAPPRRSITLKEIIEPLSKGDPRWWSAEQVKYFWDLVEVDHRSQLKALLSTNARAVFTAVRRLRRRRKREQIFNVRFDGLASCLRTPKGGSSTQYVVEINRGELRGRRLLAIEAARLQGVAIPSSAPDFRLPEKEGDARFAFGDAVCVQAVKWVAEHSIETLFSQQPAPSRRSRGAMPLFQLTEEAVRW